MIQNKAPQSRIQARSRDSYSWTVVRDDSNSDVFHFEGSYREFIPRTNWSLAGIGNGYQFQVFKDPATRL